MGHVCSHRGTPGALSATGPVNPLYEGIRLPETIAAVVFLALILNFSTMGLLIATRRPRNPIGWIMIVGGFALATTFLTGGYVDLGFYLPALARPQEMLPGTQWVAWLGYWVWVPGFVPVLTFLLLLFPDGGLPSLRWRSVVWLAVAAMITVGFGMAFAPGPFAEDHPEIRNPVGLAPLEGSPLEDGGVRFVLFGLSTVLSASSMVVRYRHAGEMSDSRSSGSLTPPPSRRSARWPARSDTPSLLWGRCRYQKALSQDCFWCSFSPTWAYRWL